jgi:oligopeptide transport system substrate-binding protein
MRVSRTKATVAVSAALVLVAAGCTTSDDDTGGEPKDGTVSIEWSEPENPLIPANTTEVQGGKVVDALFTGLISYSPKDGSVVNEMAEEIKPDDEFKTYTVKIKDGWTFHDGTPVTAESFVKTWNYNAYSPNGMANGTFFADIAGFDTTWTEDPDAEGPQKAPTPAAKELSGLKVVDDTTFTVELGGGSKVWPVKIGYTAFSPLPNAFFEKGAEEYAKNPIGNGPFKYKARTVNTSLTVTRYDDYKGREKPKVKDVLFKVYQDDEAAYNDVQSGNLDFQQQAPISSLAGEKYKQDFPDRFYDGKISTSQFISFPFYKPEFKNLKLRQALSLAIDRELIVKTIFSGTRKPMTGFVNPRVAGYVKDQCGEWCKFDPDKAKQLFAESGFKGDLSIAFNADRGGHRDWTTAVCNSITKTLGVKCNPRPIPTFDEFRTLSDDHKQVSMYRAGWQADYPLAENWLNPLWRTGASSNDGLYSNPALDAKLKEADTTSDTEKADKLYGEAEKILVDDMAGIPLWDYAQQSVWSEKVDNIVIDTFGELQLADISLK